MKLSKACIYIIRFSFFVTLVAVTFLATTTLDVTEISSSYDKLNHIFAFFVLALLLDFSFPESKFNYYKILGVLAYGVCIEIIQDSLPYRMFSLLDVVADSVGLIIYAASIPIYKITPYLKDRWQSADDIESV